MKMNFELALFYVKREFRIKRIGWNGQDQWIEMQTPDENSKMGCKYLYLKNSQGNLIPWVPSQGDLFAEDWVLVPKETTE